MSKLTHDQRVRDYTQPGQTWVARRKADKGKRIQVTRRTSHSSGLVDIGYTILDHPTLPGREGHTGELGLETLLREYRYVNPENGAAIKVPLYKGYGR